MWVARGDRAIISGGDDRSPVRNMPAVKRSTRYALSIGRHEVLVISRIIRGLHLWILLSVGLRVPLAILHLLLFLPGEELSVIR